MNTIFLTGLSWEHIGGLAGMLLTASDSGSPYIRIFGPANTYHFVSSLRHFVQRPAFHVAVQEISDRRFVLDNLWIEAVELSCDALSPYKLGKDNGYRLGEIGKMFKVFDPCSQPREPVQTGSDTSESWQPNDPCLIPPSQPVDSIICYIVTGPDLPGRFLPDQAMALGVPVGPLYKELASGGCVILENGMTVCPEQCVGPSTPGFIQIYMNVPDIKYLDALVQKQGIFEAYSKTRVKCIIHQTSLKVLWDPRYLDFIGLFDPSTQHLVVGTELADQRIIYHNFQDLQAHLNNICPYIYSPYWFSTREHVELPGVVGAGFPLQTVPLDHRSCNLSVPDRGGSVSLPEIENGTNDPFELVFLGTGSALPSKCRNVSSILLNVGTEFSVLLDCGEGTFGQLVRKYGVDGSRRILKQLKMIFVSHIHADHHLGLIRILTKVKDHRMIIVGPQRLFQFVTEYSQVHSLPDFDYVCSEQWHPSAVPLPNDLALGLVPVVHCTTSYGLVLTHSNWKIVYSGDTRPCELLISEGMDATVLIHEATFDSDLQEQAIEKRHSTISEAVQVGIKMRAQTIILTHFSQRYVVAPPYGTCPENVVCASDLMTLSPSTIPKLATIRERVHQVYAHRKSLGKLIY